ncbi:hypothetical protein FKM82_003224 [Ascaphus truei]
MYSLVKGAQKDEITLTVNISNYLRKTVTLISRSKTCTLNGTASLKHLNLFKKWGDTECTPSKVREGTPSKVREGTPSKVSFHPPSPLLKICQHLQTPLEHSCFGEQLFCWLLEETLVRVVWNYTEIPIIAIECGMLVIEKSNKCP